MSLYLETKARGVTDGIPASPSSPVSARQLFGKVVSAIKRVSTLPLLLVIDTSVELRIRIGVFSSYSFTH